MITKQVELTQLGEALGRNGTMQFKALLLNVFHTGKFVHIAPLRRNGNIGRSYIEIPVDDLSAVIKALEEIRNDVTEKRP